MQFADQLGAEGTAVTLEITPPRKQLDDVLLRRARLLGDTADAVNVIQRSGRQSSLDASIALRTAAIEPVWHLVTRGRGRAEIEAEIESAAGAGIEAALCVRGEAGPGDRADTPTLRETVGLVRASLPAACIGATANQYLPRDRVLRNLAPKLAAGASFVQTQPVLDVAALVPWVRAIRREFPGVSVVPMVMPLVTREDAERIAARLRIPVPEANLARLADGGSPGGWAIFEETVRALRGEGLADGLAIMTPQMDPPPATGARILAALRAA